MLYFIDVFQPWVLFGFILPHPTLSYPVLPVLFFFCIILSNSSLFASLQFNTATTETSDSNEKVNSLMTLLLNF